ncbi:MAG: cupin domain-containing protein [Tunicatimonas sp.]|uniref:cupin domain-containing protein n=1 Tax=Tunicatimonas sp. TaxID=1940096 RepID=UPI003C784E8C
MDKINLNEKFGRFQEHWTPKIIGELNGQQIKLAKVKDELVWHSHVDEDELFIVQKGTLYMDFRDKTVEVQEGDILVVPKGVEHLPRTNGEEVWLMLIEPKSTQHTGEVVHEKTTNNQEWI